MKIGVYLPQRAMDRSALDVARECEQLGFASVGVLDHLVPLGSPLGTPLLESFTTLAAAAAATSAIGLRTVVVRAGLRPPAMTAHLTRSLAALAGDRLVVGLGSGDAASRREDALLGLPDLDLAGRREQVHEAVAAIRAATPAVPLWLGGAGRAMRELAGELADGWNVWAATPDEVAAGAAEVAAAATRAGRPAPAVTWAGQVLLGPTPAAAEERAAAWQAGRAADRERVLLGDPAAVAARLRALATAGVGEAVVAFVGGATAEQRRLFAKSVLKQV